MHTDAKLTERQKDIIFLIEKNDKITIEDLKYHFKVSRPTITRDLAVLKKTGVLIRVQGRKTGSWLIAKKVK